MTTDKTLTDKILTTKKIAEQIAGELKVRPIQVAATIMLIDDGATIPFIARYRKEATDGLDDTQLRTLEERLIYLRELEERKIAIIASIEEQGKLTPELRAEIENATTKQKIEDLYLPYKPKRRTKAQIAREAGLQPLADEIFANHQLIPEEVAQKYIHLEPETPDKHIPDVKSALQGAKYILSETFSEDAQVLEKLRNLLLKQGLIVSKVVEGKENEGEKFRDWFDFQEAIATIPSHRALALFRGRNLDMLRLSLKTPNELLETPLPSPCEELIAAHYRINSATKAGKWLLEVVRFTWAVKLSIQLEVELMGQLRERAEDEAIRVFAKNLHDLLLAPPAGLKVTMGLDPGIRTGVKVAVVDDTGKVVATDTIYPHAPRNDWDGSLVALARHIKKHKVELIAIGNGTASRETSKLAGDIIKLIYENDGSKIIKIVVSESGASVYSASELAAKEFPNLDVSLRGAVSIARRLQDPLAELVKIDPKSIGVGQYQHDINQSRLARTLDAVVEDCVNAVGVDVNTASVPLLARISGLNKTLAENIIKFRDENGKFTSREQIKKIARIGGKTFEQAAGFLRINNGENPLDSSSVHPESYPLVEKILNDIGKKAKDIIGDINLLKNIKADKYIDDKFGLPTIRDILKELEKPGRDPRPEFTTANFQDGVEDIKDLKVGVILEGVVTNVTNFGAFVDIGVHQDGLVHISALANTFVTDPHKVVKAGDVVQVKVLEVDVVRKRIALTMRLSDTPAVKNNDFNSQKNQSVKSNFRPAQTTNQPIAPLGTLAQAFAKIKVPIK